jgi:phage-related tail protein
MQINLDLLFGRYVAEGQSQHDHFGGGMGAEDHGTAQGSEAGQPRQANREAEPATDEVDDGADGNSSADLGQGQEEHFGAATTSEDRDNGGAWAQAEDYEEARELYLEKLEALHRLMRKVHAIKARTSTAGHDPLPEIGACAACGVRGGACAMVWLRSDNERQTTWTRSTARKRSVWGAAGCWPTWTTTSSKMRRTIRRAPVPTAAPTPDDAGLL